MISAIQEIRGIRLIDIARRAASGSKTKRFLDAQPEHSECAALVAHRALETLRQTTNVPVL